MTRAEWVRGRRLVGGVVGQCGPLEPRWTVHAKKNASRDSSNLARKPSESEESVAEESMAAPKSGMGRHMTSDGPAMARSLVVDNKVIQIQPF